MTKRQIINELLTARRNPIVPFLQDNVGFKYHVTNVGDMNQVALKVPLRLPGEVLLHFTDGNVTRAGVDKPSFLITAGCLILESRFVLGPRIMRLVERKDVDESLLATTLQRIDRLDPAKFATYLSRGMGLEPDFRKARNLPGADSPEIHFSERLQSLGAQAFELFRTLQKSLNKIERKLVQWMLEDQGAHLVERFSPANHGGRPL